VSSPEQPSDLLTSCALIGTSTWSDALDECGIAGVVRGLARRSGQGRFAGFAVTARQSVDTLGSFGRMDFGIGKILDAAGPGAVLMIGMGGAEVSTLGGLAALAAKMKGVAGIVIDGACRDVDEIASTGLWVSSRHLVPTSGKTRARLETLGMEANVGGVRVRNGDLVIGDDTGIVVVPQHEITRVLKIAEQMMAKDMAVEKALKAGKSFAEATAAAKF
jgi:regulator of RNase E activity RraA